MHMVTIFDPMHGVVCVLSSITFVTDIKSSKPLFDTGPIRTACGLDDLLLPVAKVLA